MNKAYNGVVPYDHNPTNGHYEERIRRIMAKSDCLLRYALEYIDRWVMYNQLFNPDFAPKTL